MSTKTPSSFPMGIRIFNGYTPSVALLFMLGCGASPVETPSIVADASPTLSAKAIGDTDSPGEIGDDTSITPIAQLIKRDAHIARDILIESLSSEDTGLASWAAVYIRLLNVNANANTVEQKLLEGSQSDDVLLKSLCHRWLVNTDDLAKISISDIGDPVPRLFLALSMLSHSTPDVEPLLSDILDVGPGIFFHEEKVAFNTLLRLTAPFDNGPVALAIAFINSKRMSLAIEVEGITVPRSAGYRQQLLSFFNIKTGIPSPAEQSESLVLPGTSVHLLLENPLIAQPLPALRNVIVSATGSLKRDALRALAASALEPEVNDFAASASAFHSQDAHIRIEAARTFLLLVTRATKD